MSVRYYVNHAPQQTLAGSITNSATSLTIASSFAGWPTSYPFFAELDRGTASAEIVSVTNISGLVATIVRAQDGDAAVSHPAGATLDFVVIAKDFREANAHVNANNGVHGVSGNVVGDSDVQTLGNKTLTNPTVNSETLTGTVANTATHAGNPALIGKASVGGGKSLSLRDSTGAEKVSVTDVGNTAIAGTLSVTGSLTVGGQTYGTAQAIHVYTSGATWTKPSNLKGVRVRVVGGGGGSGGCTGAGTGRSASGGGGAGGYSEQWIPAASLLATETVTVGAAGTAGANGTTDGGAGGTSSFGSHCSATGGAGGQQGGTSTTGNAAPFGGAGGLGSGGDINVQGGPGANALIVSGTLFTTGLGGSCPLGGGGAPRNNVGAGSAGGNYGGGASGASASTANQAGAAGAAGVVIVEEFYF